jgi:uncharacterized protein (DUF169 family)
MTIDEFVAKGTELKNQLALQRPVGLRFCKSMDEVPAKAKRPMRDFKVHMALCQGVNLARTYGYTIAMDLDDMYCMMGASLFGLTDFDFSFYPHHVRDQAAADNLDAILKERNALLPGGTYKAIVVSPIDRLLVEPDVIICYGSPTQTGRIAKAFTWFGEAVTATYFGGTGCSAIIVSFVQKKPILCIPAGGEKVLAGTQENEMDIVFPADRLDDVLAGLKGTQRMLPYPTVISTALNEPVVPADYPITYKELHKG